MAAGDVAPTRAGVARPSLMRWADVSISTYTCVAGEREAVAPVGRRWYKVTVCDWYIKQAMDMGADHVAGIASNVRWVDDRDCGCMGAFLGVVPLPACDPGWFPRARRSQHLEPRPSHSHVEASQSPPTVAGHTHSRTHIHTHRHSTAGISTRRP